MKDQQFAALSSFREKFLGFDIDAIDREADGMLAAGVTIRQFLDTCTPIMAEVGERFEKGEYYLPHLVMAGEMFKTASRKIKSSMRAGEAGPAIAEIVLGTPMGDIHDLGKDIFGVLAEASGFAVHNLGVDVPPDAFIARLEETGAAFLGLSSLLTTTFGTIEKIVALLDKKGLRKNTCVLLGGGATEQSLVQKLGVDFQTRDAYEGITFIKRLTDGEMKGGGA
ncbi:MAG: cobalamin B12-binding domain-containing protein [Thermodesulfobacteriota bacterium]